MRGVVAGAVIVGLAIVMAGCGGSGISDEKQIAKVVEDYNAAVAAGNGGAACSLLDTAGKDVILAQVSAGVSCEQAIMRRWPGEDERVEKDKAKFSKVTNVQVRGSQAQADVPQAVGGPTTAKLAKVGAAWKIAQPAGITGQSSGP